MAEEKKIDGNTKSTKKKSPMLMLVICCVAIGLGISFYFINNTQPPVQPKLEEAPVDATISSLVTATAVEPQNSLLWVQLANAYYDTTNVSKAIEAFSKALSLNPNMPEVMVDYGTMLRADGKYTEALEQYNNALSLNKNHLVALYNKGLLLYYNLGEKEQGIATWKILVENNSNARTPDGRLIKALLETMKP